MWTTGDEIAFIQNMGKFRDNRRPEPKSRLELLRAYKESLKSRQLWTSLDREKINRAVDEAIKSEHL
jgi:hypothetical protein